MTTQRDEHERTMAFAELALSQIMALRLSATPRNFELWYNYATGYDPALNQIINDALAAKGHLTDEHVEQIHNSHIAPARITDRIESVGTTAGVAIESLMALIEGAVGTAAGHAESLAEIREQLGAADTQKLSAIVESLTATAGDMERANRSLEARLTAARRDLVQLREALAAVRGASLTDALTSLPNRKHFDDVLGRAATTANRSTNEPLS